MSSIFRHYDGIYVSQRFTVCVPDGKQGKWFWVFDFQRIFLWICNKSCPKNYGTAIITPFKLIISVRSSKKCFFNNTFTLPFYSSLLNQFINKLQNYILYFLNLLLVFISYIQLGFLYIPRFFSKKGGTASYLCDYI